MDVDQCEARFAPHSFVSDVECYREDGVIRCRVEVESPNAITEMIRKVFTDEDRVIESDVVDGFLLIEPGQADDSESESESESDSTGDR